MSTRHDALFAMQEVTENHELALRALRYFFAKYPAQALESLAVVPHVPREKPFKIEVPSRRDAQGYGWNAASHTLPANVVKGFWAVDPANRKIEAIKYLRAETGILLKEAKDLMEYMVEYKVGK